MLSSAPPVNPAESVGRVVLYSHWESGVRGNESTAKGLYEMSVRKDRSEVSKWNTAVSDGKRPKSRKPHEPPLFENLAQSTRDQFEVRSQKDIPWGYYMIHSCSIEDELQQPRHRVTMYETHYGSFLRAEQFFQGKKSGD